jgi:hypothetical protein
MPARGTSMMCGSDRLAQMSWRGQARHRQMDVTQLARCCIGATPFTIWPQRSEDDSPTEWLVLSIHLMAVVFASSL